MFAPLQKAHCHCTTAAAGRRIVASGPFTVLFSGQDQGGPTDSAGLTPDPYPPRLSPFLLGTLPAPRLSYLAGLPTRLLPSVASSLHPRTLFALSAHLTLSSSVSNTFTAPSVSTPPRKELHIPYGVPLVFSSLTRVSKTWRLLPLPFLVRHVDATNPPAVLKLIKRYKLEKAVQSLYLEPDIPLYEPPEPTSGSDMDPSGDFNVSYRYDRRNMEFHTRLLNEKKRWRSLLKLVAPLLQRLEVGRRLRNGRGTTYPGWHDNEEDPYDFDPGQSLYSLLPRSLPQLAALIHLRINLYLDSTLDMYHPLLKKTPFLTHLAISAYTSSPTITETDHGRYEFCWTTTSRPSSSTSSLALSDMPTCKSNSTTQHETFMPSIISSLTLNPSNVSPSNTSRHSLIQANFGLPQVPFGNAVMLLLDPPPSLRFLSYSNLNSHLLNFLLRKKAKSTLSTHENLERLTLEFQPIRKSAIEKGRAELMRIRKILDKHDVELVLNFAEEFGDQEGWVDGLPGWGIAHCGLSLDNILLDKPTSLDRTTAEDPEIPPCIKLAGFGFSQWLVEGGYEPYRDPGSRRIRSAEQLLLEQSYGDFGLTSALDIWAIGVVTSLLLFDKNLALNGHQAKVVLCDYVDPLRRYSTTSEVVVALASIDPEAGWPRWFEESILVKEPDTRFPFSLPGVHPLPPLEERVEAEGRNQDPAEVKQLASFLKACWVLDPEKRPSAKQLLEHEWLRGVE
ncbi:hypothetical protein JCM11641_000797 [Rhodosporidiobolus odoratus]